jgi:hypothetical protein
MKMNMSGYYSLDAVGIAAGYIEAERRREAEEQRLVRVAENIKRAVQAPRCQLRKLAAEPVQTVVSVTAAWTLDDSPRDGNFQTTET